MANNSCPYPHLRLSLTDKEKSCISSGNVESTHMSDEDVIPPPNITHLPQLQGNVHLIEAHHMQIDEMKNVRQMKWHY